MRTTVALKIQLLRTSKPWGVPSPRQARWYEFFSKFDLHVVYTPGPSNPVGALLSRWAYPANPALGDVSIHGTAQAAGDVRDMMAGEKEELLARPIVFRAVSAPVVTRSRAASRAQEAPACNPPPLASAPVGGRGRSKRKNFGNWSELPGYKNLGSPTGRQLLYMGWVLPMFLRQIGLDTTQIANAGK